MYGAIIGDMVGSIYEHDPIRKKTFPFFQWDSRFTDDTVMTVAVFRALRAYDREREDALEVFQAALVKEMQRLGRKYPRAGYGKSFFWWIYAEEPEPYGSYGNGSAMRVSPVGDFAVSLDEALALAKASAAVTHNHPEGIKGAQAVAAAVWMAKNGSDKEEIRAYIDEHFYPMNFSLRKIWWKYRFDVRCQGSVPQAIMCFLEGKNFEDVIRNCIWLGGDCDTTAAIAGGIAEAYYGIEAWMLEEMWERLGDLKEELA